MTFPFSRTAGQHTGAMPLKFRALGPLEVTSKAVETSDAFPEEFTELRAKLLQAEEKRLADIEQARTLLMDELQAEHARELQQVTEKFQLEITKALSTFSGERERYFEDAESEVVKLALAVARRILHREVTLDPLMLRGVVHVALEQMSSHDEVSLLVPVEDQGAWSRLFERHPLKVESDPLMKPGECRLRAKSGSVDLGIEAQLAEIESSFCELLRKRPE